VPGSAARSGYRGRRRRCPRRGVTGERVDEERGVEQQAGLENGVVVDADGDRSPAPAFGIEQGELAVAVGEDVVLAPHARAPQSELTVGPAHGAAAEQAPLESPDDDAGAVGRLQLPPESSASEAPVTSGRFGGRPTGGEALQSQRADALQGIEGVVARDAGELTVQQCVTGRSRGLGRWSGGGEGST